MCSLFVLSSRKFPRSFCMLKCQFIEGVAGGCEEYGENIGVSREIDWTTITSHVSTFSPSAAFVHCIILWGSVSCLFNLFSG